MNNRTKTDADVVSTLQVSYLSEPLLGGEKMKSPWTQAFHSWFAVATLVIATLGTMAWAGTFSAVDYMFGIRRTYLIVHGSLGVFCTVAVGITGFLYVRSTPRGTNELHGVVWGGMITTFLTFLFGWIPLASFCSKYGDLPFIADPVTGAYADVRAALQFTVSLQVITFLSALYVTVAYIVFRHLHNPTANLYKFDKAQTNAVINSTSDWDKNSIGAPQGA